MPFGLKTALPFHSQVVQFLTRRRYGIVEN
jgi:hypothetical protein